MKERRSDVEIVGDMLESVQKAGRIKPTHLMYKSNLSHTRMKGYLEKLLGQKLLEETMDGGTKYFVLTDAGYNALGEYRKMKAFIESFGF